MLTVFVTQIPLDKVRCPIEILFVRLTMKIKYKRNKRTTKNLDIAA